MGQTVDGNVKGSWCWHIQWCNVRMCGFTVLVLFQPSPAQPRHNRETGFGPGNQGLGVSQPSRTVRANSHADGFGSADSRPIPSFIHMHTWQSGLE